MTQRDWTLLVIAAGNGTLAPVQLQKSLFLLSRNLTCAQLEVSRLYNFEPYDYGPFCSAVYRDAETLEAEGLVHIDGPPMTRFKLYHATDDGQLRAAELRSIASSEAVEYAESVVSTVQRLSFNDLVGAIYEAYPEMKVNSVFQG